MIAGDISFLQKNQSCPNNGQESNHRKGQKSGYQFGPNWYPPKMCQMSGYHFWQNWYSPKMCQKSGYHFWQNWYPPKMCQKSGYHFCHILISIKSTWISISLIINLKGKLLYSWWYLPFFCKNVISASSWPAPRAPRSAFSVRRMVLFYFWRADFW